GFWLLRFFVVLAPAVLPLIGWRFGCGRRSVFGRRVDEVEALVEFKFGGRALVDFLVKRADAFVGLFIFVEFREGAGTVSDEGIVEEEKGLLRDGGVVALAHMNVGVGEIEHAKG